MRMTTKLAGAAVAMVCGLGLACDVESDSRAEGSFDRESDRGGRFHEICRVVGGDEGANDTYCHTHWTKVLATVDGELTDITDELGDRHYREAIRDGLREVEVHYETPSERGVLRIDVVLLDDGRCKVIARNEGERFDRGSAEGDEERWVSANFVHEHITANESVAEGVVDAAIEMGAGLIEIGAGVAAVAAATATPVAVLGGAMIVAGSLQFARGSMHLAQALQTNGRGDTCGANGGDGHDHGDNAEACGVAEGADGGFDDPI